MACAVGHWAFCLWGGVSLYTNHLHVGVERLDRGPGALRLGEKILFVADLFNPGLFPAPQAAPYVWGVASGGLYDEVKRLDLDVQRIAGGHGVGTGTMEALRITGGR